MNKINLKYTGIIALILFASFSRIIPHMPNFTPIGAMALFGGAYLKNKSHAFLIPVLSLWISDLVINNFVFCKSYKFKVFARFRRFNKLLTHSSKTSSNS